MDRLTARNKLVINGVTFTLNLIYRTSEWELRAKCPGDRTRDNRLILKFIPIFKEGTIPRFCFSTDIPTEETDLEAFHQAATLMQAWAKGEI